MRRLMLAAILLAGCGSQQGVKPPPATSKQPDLLKNRIYPLAELPVADLRVNGKPVKAWVVDDELKRAEGMMWLRDENVRQDQGMLFVFPKAQPMSFWMKNTLMPLDIAFISPKGKILNIQQGKPEDETPLPSKGSALYVLEMKAGSMQALGAKPGSQIAIPDSVAQGER